MVRLHRGADNPSVRVITLWYRSPAIKLGTKRYRREVDVWAVECVLVDIALKQSLLKGDCELDQLFEITILFGTPTEKDGPSAKEQPYFSERFSNWVGEELAESLNPFCDAQSVDLVQLMLKYDPSLRLSMRHTLNRSFSDN
ncbi:Cell division protein kinase 1, partial [Parelaphostrongylus tenuis]